MKEKIHLSVRSLVEQTCRSGDLHWQVSGLRAGQEGVRGHQAVQLSRPEGYAAEVPVRYEFETDEVVLVLSGRVDGILRLPDRVVVEEIKTFTREPDLAEAGENAGHWAQVLVYAYVLAETESLERIDARLTYCHLPSGRTQETTRSLTRAELAAFFLDLTARFAILARDLAAWRRLRDEAIKTLAFPFEAYRAGQRHLAAEVYRTIREGGQLLAQAPTGIGKTMAVLFPALKALGEGLTDRIFYLTAQGTGRAAARQAVRQLEKNGLKLRSLTLTAREKICPNDRVVCHPEGCRLAKGHFDRVGRALTAAFEQSAWTRAAVEALAQEHEVCPFELSLDLILWADLVICDYNYVFDPRVHLVRAFQQARSAPTFLVDEAHRLLDRAREMYSAELVKQPFLDLRRTVGRETPGLYRALTRLNTSLLAEKKRCDRESGVFSDPEPPRDLYPRLETFLEAAAGQLAGEEAAAGRGPLLERFFEAGAFLKAAERYDERYVTMGESWGRDLRLKLFCLDPSRELGQVFQRARAAVLFSATLEPMPYFQETLGCAAEARQVRLPSPFPAGHFCLLVADRISTRYRERDASRAEVAEAVAAAARARSGNYLCFFPSYAYLEKVRDLLAAGLDRTDLLVQAPDMTEEDRRLFLERFGRPGERTLLGLAVMGGLFGEGIDLVGERLSGAVIVGVGLPGLSLERDLIRAHFDRTGGRGFEYAYLFPGLIRVLQAAGRVIRSETDRGVVLLIDDRFGQRRYRELFPAEWRPIRVRDGAEIARVLGRFWAGRP